MKNMLLIAVGLMLSVLVGCVSAPAKDGEAKPVSTSIAQKIQAVKANGCDSLPELERRLFVLFIKTQVPQYPINGFCDPSWFSDELIKQIDKLENSNDA